MPKPRRIQLSRKRGWKKPEGAVVCSRPGRWGNPFPLHAELEELRKSPEEFEDIERSARLNVVHDFEEALRAGELKFTVEDVRRELRGRSLACWCRLCPKHVAGRPWDFDCTECAPCHVDVLLRKANEC